jgi:hypothetical protein
MLVISYKLKNKSMGDKNYINKIIGELIETVYWLYSVIYAFKFWGFGWGLLNIFIPFAPLWDLVNFLINKIGKIN